MFDLIVSLAFPALITMWHVGLALSLRGER